jgi:putative ABC transport system permease protein
MAIGRITTLRRRMSRWLRPGRHDADLRAEIESHRALVQADLESRGLAPADAAFASRRVMGNMALSREDARDVWAFGALDALLRDAAHGIRGLRREPTFAIAAILTVALGVVTTATVFSVVDAQLWKPLPFPDSDRLVAIRAMGPGGPRDAELVPGGDLLDWRARSRTFEDFAGVGRTMRRVLRRETAESVVVTTVTPSFFRTLRRAPIAGRTYDLDEHAAAAVLTDRSWRRLFGEASPLVGSSVVLDAESLPIVAVVPADESLGPDPDFYVTIPTGSDEFRDRTARTFNVIGRLRSGVDPRAALAELQTIVADLARDHPAGRAGHTVDVQDLREYYTGSNWRPLYFFLGASLIVLVLSSVNVATLLLARALRRAREFAIRGALGGGRRALVRQLLVEGALVAVPGGILGVLATNWALAFFTTRLPEEYLLRGSHIPVDVRVCAFAFAVTALTTLAFGLAPSVFARRVNLAMTLGHGARMAGHPPAHVRLRHALLAAEVALTVVLLAGAGVFLKSFVALTHVPLGFEPSDRAAARLSLSGPAYAADAPVVAYGNALLERTRAIPAVTDAAIASTSPLGSGPRVLFVVPGRERPAPGNEPRAILRAVTPGYFRTLGIPLVEGREFGAEDSTGAPRTAIVNEYLARRMFPDEDPLGRTIELLPGARAPWTRRPGRLTIVGVAANVKEVGLNEIAFQDIYVPFAQMPATSFEVIAHAAVPSSTIAGAMRTAALAVDPNLPVITVALLESRAEDALSGDRFNLLLIASFAAVAVILATVGVYGAVSYAVQERTHEFGVRLALGAPPHAIVTSALGYGARIGALGGTAGILCSLAVARLLGNALYLVPGDHNGLLYGVKTIDPASFATAFAVVVAVGVVASAGPARQIARVDPLITLRHD